MSANNYMNRRFSSFMHRFVTFFALKTPAPIKTIFKKMGIVKLWRSTYDKYDAELTFQKTWATIFKNNREKALEYYKKYRFFDDIVAICGIDDGTKILDIGCGISTILHYIKGEKTGLDPLAEEYKELYEYPSDINVIKGFGENIPFADEYFDAVISTNNLDHVTDPQKTVNEINRVLRTGGFFILTVEFFETNVERDLAHPFSFTIKDIHDLLAAKFDVIFEKEATMIGIQNYIQGINDVGARELTIIAKKVKN